MTCVYEPSEEMQPKFWCKPGKVRTCAYHIIITSEEQPMVQEGRFSIRDNRALQLFTVTVEGLAERDMGTYCCGVQRGKIQHDKSADVEVILSPGQSLHMLPSPHSTSDHHVAGARTGLQEEMVPGFWGRERDKGGTVPGRHPLHLPAPSICRPDAQPGFCRGDGRSAGEP